MRFRLQSSHRQKSLSGMKLSEDSVLAAIVKPSENQMSKDLETGTRSDDSLRESSRFSDTGSFSHEEEQAHKASFEKLKVLEKQTLSDTSLLQMDDPIECRQLPQDPIYKRIFKEIVCNKFNPDVGKASRKVASLEISSTETSQKMNDSAHKASERSRSKSFAGFNKEFNLHARQPENEINFVGGLEPCVGNKRSDKHPQRPTVQRIFRMRTGNYPVVSLTENPRESHCAVPRTHQKIIPLKKVTEKVSLADNVDSESPSATSILECEKFDLENPLNLDLQGQDYRQTYQNDVQEAENAREYNHQLLHMKRKLMKIEVENLSEQREFKKKYALPEFFDPDADFEESQDGDKGDKEEDSIIEQIIARPLSEYEKQVTGDIQKHEEPEVLAKLFRTTTKKQNQEIIENELRRRIDRYYQLWVQRKQKEIMAAKKQLENDKIKAENFVMELGEQFFEELFKDKYQECLKLYESLPPLHVSRTYPHTLRETKRLKQKMAESRKIIREKAMIRTKIFETNGFVKNNPVIPPEAQPVSSAESLSEQSTDDEDDHFVGIIEDEVYQLRGFHYKLDAEPRGLKDRKHKTKLERPPRICQTRSSWFQQLIPDKSPPALLQHNPSSLKRSYLPHDPNINLFPPEFKTVKGVDKAPIKEYIMKSSPDSYAQRKQVRLKIKKPKYIKVKKFTLTGYMYGAKKQKKIKEKSWRGSSAGRKMVFEKFFKQVQAYSDEKRLERRTKRHQRLQYLGIPYNKNNENEVKNSCESSETESSDWIPNDNENKTDLEGNQKRSSKLNHGPFSYDVVKHHTTVPNMRAPKFRYPTRPRTKDDSPYVSDATSADSVSFLTIEDPDESPRFQKQISPRAPYNVPRLAPIPPDVIKPANLEVKKTEYIQLFDARHHHSHADPTDHKDINVRYKNKLPDVSIPEGPSTRKISKQKQPFEKAYPRGKDYKERDLSLPKVVIEDEISKFEKRKHIKNISAKQAASAHTILEAKEKSYKSRQEYEDDLPGKSEYIEVVRKMAAELRRELENIKESGNKLAINEEEFGKEIMREIESINSCVTSLESSTCTNFTNDSGSFIMIQDKKVPCDYITKSFVPFEEIDRVRVKATLGEADDEYNSPYFTVPFSGQKQDQVNLAKVKDKFYTYTQRSRVGVRQRLEVKTPNFNTELLGTKKFKAPSRLATELDENFLHEIRNRPPVNSFKRKTTMMTLRDGLRRKFETFYIREQIVEQQIVQKKESEYAKEIIKLRDMCQDLFQKWQEQHYHTSMLMLEKIKPFYQKTDLLKKRYHELEKQMIKLNMRIVFIEDDWIRRTILQNFHYLIMEKSWRLEHDWIHLQEDGTLENFRTSINKRKTVNIRKRDRDDAWAIKEYYETVYVPNKHPIKIVFPNVKTFIDGVNQLKVRTYICLMETSFSMRVLADLQLEYNQFTRDSQRCIEQTTKTVKNRGANRYFMEDRAKVLDNEAQDIIDKPLQMSIASPQMRTIEPLCDMLYVQLVPQHFKNNVKDDCTALDKLRMIFRTVVDALGKLDRIPAKKRKKIEEAYRKKLAYNKRQSKHACFIEKRIHLTLEEVKRNMAPPYKKPKREGKLPRVFFQKKKIVKKKEIPQISQKNKTFIQAFTECNAEKDPLEGADSDILDSLQDNCIPFYFDHFLRLHDYEPNYDFKTQIELNEGPEDKRLMYKDVMNSVMKGLEAWQLAKKKKMEEDIQKTMYLYVDNDNTKNN